MKRTLYLLRHGKSDWAQPGAADIERPLMKKGVKRSQRMAEYLHRSGLPIDLIISSPAVRAYETARIFAGQWGCQLSVEEMLYPTRAQAILDLLWMQPDDLQNLMLCGHNLGLSDFVMEYIDPRSEWLSTSAVAALRFEADSWHALPTAPKLDTFVLHYRDIKDDKQHPGHGFTAW